MKCSCCGYENSQNAKFCSGCGSPLDSAARAANNQPANVKGSSNEGYDNIECTQTLQPPTMGNNTYSADRFNDTYRVVTPQNPIVRSKKKKSSTLKILLISLITVIIFSVTFLLLYFCTDVFGKNCKICDREFDSDGQYCNDCVQKYTCIGCEKVNKNVKEGVCEECIDDFTCTECGEIDAEINKSLCTSCAEEYTCENCGEIDFGIEEGYCQDCTENYICEECGMFDEELEEGFCSDCIMLFTCKDCELFDEKMKDNYCDECKENHTCKECRNIADELSGGYCAECIDDGEKDLCFYCHEQINTLTSYKDSDGYFYCDDCDTGYYCSYCRAPVAKGKALCNYCG